MQDTQKGQFEKNWLRQSTDLGLLVGVDEVGRGCIAGPVYCAALVLDYVKLFKQSACDLALIRDSKTLSAKQRSEVLPLIYALSVHFAVARAEVEEIEVLGIVPATFLAMNRALSNLACEIALVLVDGNQTIKDCKFPQKAVVAGDAICYNIAAASILAKQARDHYMQTADQRHPGYGFAQHVGYGTKAHLLALEKLGACSEHRRRFAPVRNQIAAI